MLNESNIINISTETLVVKIPMIFKEDIDAYQLYLQQRLDTNSAIIEEWEMMFNTFATSCAKEPTQEAQQKCEKQRQEAMSSFIEFKNTNWVRFQNQIYANLIILQKYRDFPFEIYERIHVIDRYMSEIASLINNTL